MPTIQELVGARVRELRKARGWTLEELAEKADKHYTYIGGLERGDRNVTVEVLGAVADALQVPIKSLFNLQPHPLEVKLNAASDDILSAIQKGFRAMLEVISGLYQKCNLIAKLVISWYHNYSMLPIYILLF